MKFYLLLAFLCPLFLWSAPVGLFLTWQGDPQTTMTIVWVTNPNEAESVVEWREAISLEWNEISGISNPFPEEMPYLIHRVELTGLKSGKDYIFRIGKTGFSHKFQTLNASGNETIRFIVGGDIYHDGIPILEEMNKTAAKVSPHFALLGGDISYAGSRWKNGMTASNENWIEWLSCWQKTMKTPEGNLIPLIPAIGNHDVNGRFDQTPEQAKVFYALFPFPGIKGCNVLDFGELMSIFVLDTNHTHPVEGEQTKWLAGELAKRSAMTHTFALYHVPAYPCARKFFQSPSSKIRRHWVPLFEKYKLRMAFENHDHVYKRSVPIIKGKQDANGVIYLGDGAWGVKDPRKPRANWFIAKSAQERHVILVTVSKNVTMASAINSKGEPFDHVILRK